jgi:hypothetical protein
MKDTISGSEAEIRQVLSEIEEGTESTILNDKINFIRSLLTEQLERIDFKMYLCVNEAKST